jgi:CheY-like chemotaxis protein
MSGGFVMKNPVVTGALLVTEGYPTALSSLSELLRYEGYRVIEAADTHAAISQIDANMDLAAVLADLDLPNWRLLVQHASVIVPQAFILGMAQAQSMPESSELQRRGIRLCLPKPLVFQDLRQALRRRLAGGVK